MGTTFFVKDNVLDKGRREFEGTKMSPQKYIQVVINVQIRCYFLLLQ